MPKSDITNSIGEAKKYFSLNLSTNVFSLAILSIIELWMTRFLIDHLGVTLYGIIPTTTAMVSYAGLLSLTLTSSVGRFIAINLDGNQVQKSKIYFTSGFFGLVMLGGAVLTLAFFTAPFLNRVFTIPTGQEGTFIILFLMVIISSVMGAICSPFMVSAFVTHRFYLQNLLNFASKILRSGIIVIGFIFLGSSLNIVGIGYFSMGFMTLILSVLLAKKLTPQLTIDKKFFRWNALREMGRMGGWVALDQIGTLLYLSTDLIIINLLLGPEKAGFYAPLLQMVILMRLLTPAMSNLFAPIAIEYIAKGDFATLSFQIQRAIKFLGLVLALPIGMICGFSGIILEKWLGTSFAGFGPLVWLLLGPQVFFLAIDPLYNVNRGMNKVKIPALATLFGGIVNVILSIFFISYFKMGLYGVAISNIISFGLRTVLFTPIYSCLYLKENIFTYIKALLPGGVIFTIVSLSAMAANYLAGYNSIIILLTIICFIAVFGILLIFNSFLNEDERRFVLSILRIGKRGEVTT